MINFTPLSPMFLEIWPLQFHYYWLMYAISFLAVYLFLKKKLVDEKSKIQITEKKFDKFFFWIIALTLIWWRFWHILFYNFDFFFQNPVEILKVWKWWMASHWGFLWASIWFILFRPKEIPFFKLADLTILLVPLWLALWRIWNLINWELYWKATNLPWCMEFADEICRHPTQIYASLKDITIFLILFYLFRKKVKNWVIFSSFLISYWILRFIVEFFKEETQWNNYLEILTTGQILSFFMILTGILLLLFLKKENNRIW